MISSPQPKPSRGLELNERQLNARQKTNPKLKPSKSLHLSEIQYKRKKTMRRFNFFCWVNFPSQNLPQHYPFELRTRTFQKHTAQGEAKNKPKAKTFQKPTPEWDTIKRRENHAEAYTWMRNYKKEGKPCGVLTFFAKFVFPARTFHNTALLSYEPEPSRSLQLKEKQKTNPKLKPSRSLHLNEIL